MHPVIDILAGIPSLIFGYGYPGYCAVYLKIPGTAVWGQYLGYTIITGAIVLSVMIIPFVLNILLMYLKQSLMN